jgi:hypothetical protein
MLRIRVGWVCWVVLFLAFVPSVASAQTCTTQACAFVAGIPYLIPTGSAIASLDGVIGPEWSGAFDKPTAVWIDGRRLPIDIYLVQDGEYLFLAIRVAPKERYTETLRVSIHFGNDDTNAFGPGDNLILLAENLGQGGVDYHYEGYDKRVLDVSQDAWGVGRWDPYARAYEFEAQIRLASGDPQDMTFQVGVQFIVVVGLETVGRDGKVTSELKTPNLLMTI